mmetsp:Transcript_952/g.2057  ORF Transcript_952/g.2057 Transcript_952/m.2057 type:complete len:319 (-) Transcript_952:516-1472(-)
MATVFAGLPSSPPLDRAPAAWRPLRLRPSMPSGTHSASWPPTTAWKKASRASSTRRLASRAAPSLRPAAWFIGSSARAAASQRTTRPSPAGLSPRISLPSAVRLSWTSFSARACAWAAQPRLSKGRTTLAPGDPAHDAGRGGRRAGRPSDSGEAEDPPAAPAKPTGPGQSVPLPPSPPPPPGGPSRVGQMPRRAQAPLRASKRSAASPGLPASRSQPRSRSAGESEATSAGPSSASDVARLSSALSSHRFLAPARGSAAVAATAWEEAAACWTVARLVQNRGSLGASARACLMWAAAAACLPHRWRASPRRCHASGLR